MKSHVLKQSTINTGANGSKLLIEPQQYENVIANLTKELTSTVFHI